MKCLETLNQIQPQGIKRSAEREMRKKAKRHFCLILFIHPVNNLQGRLNPK